MSRISLLLSTAGPGSSDLLRWDLGSKPKKELILSNPSTEKDSIAEMALRVEHVFAIDENGEEHFVTHLAGERLMLGSQTRSNSLKLEGPIELNAGRYTKMRFYIAAGSSQTNSARVTEKLSDIGFIDFEVKEGLSIETGEVFELQLSFHLSSFSFRSFWDSYGEMIYASWMKGRLGAF